MEIHTKLTSSAPPALTTTNILDNPQILALPKIRQRIIKPLQVLNLFGVTCMGFGNMPTKLVNENRPSVDLLGNPSPAIYSEPWWCSTGYNSARSVIATGNSPNEPSLCLNPNSVPSFPNSEPNVGYDVNDGSKNSHKEADHDHQQEGSIHRDDNNVVPSAPVPGSDKGITQHTRLELVGHSMACAPIPYTDPSYGTMMAAYGAQHMMYPNPLGPHHVRMPLPLEVAQEPVYVNAKQYHGILRRRQSRAKAELEKKLIKVRKPYLHESRHQHAIRRERGTGGRFAKKTDAENKGSAVQSVSSSGSEPMPSGSPSQNQKNQNDVYERGSAFQPTSYHSGNRNDDNDCCTQQWGSISSNNQATSQRRFAIQ